MALTDQQKADVRIALGWSARFHQTDSRLEQAMSALDSEPEHEAQVVALLAEVVDIKTKLKTAHSRLKAVKVGSINLDGLRTELAGLRMEGRRHTGEMAAILGVERRHDIFSSSGPRGFASVFGLGGGNDSSFI